MEDHEDTVADALQRLEWHDGRTGRGTRAGQVTRRTALTGGAAGLAAMLLQACGSSAAGDPSTHAASTGASASGNPVASIFGVKGGYRFTFVNHLTASQFFVPTINGIADACTLLNCSYQWTGSTANNASQMAAAINVAIGARVDGIATTLIARSLAKPVAAATRAGIPVVAYNADQPGTKRLAYIGQDPLSSGLEMGRRIHGLMPQGGKALVFIATPGSADLAPRLTGIEQALGGTTITVASQASGASEQQQGTTIGALIGKSPGAYQGYFAVDAGSTTAVAQAISNNGLKGKVVGGGFGLSPQTVQLLADDTIQFAIDEQPYLQGFFPVLELFLYRATDGLAGAADVDTGLKLLDPRTVRPYLTTKSRYEGTSTAVGVQRG